jgi:hypothetical protein
MTSAIQPHNYDLPNNLSKLAQHPDFLKLQKAHGGDKVAALGEELKRVVDAEHKAQLATFEQHVGEVTLARLKDRLDKQSKTEEARAAIDAARKHDIATDWAVQPSNYNLPDHMERIRTGSQQLRAIANSHGFLIAHEELRRQLEAELRGTLKDNNAAALAAFEKHVGERALADLAKKLEASKAA